jgi:hypothetical protein
MSKKKDREQARRQAQWEKENADIENRWTLALAMKAALRKHGCLLRLYELFDSFETEFANLIARGKAQFASLHEVFEVAPTEPDDDRTWRRLHRLRSGASTRAAGRHWRSADPGPGTRTSGGHRCGDQFTDENCHRLVIEAFADAMYVSGERTSSVVG